MVETDFNGIKIRERADFLSDLQDCVEGKAGDLTMHKWFAKCIKKWDYEGDPSDLESYQNLGMVAHKEVVSGFLTAYFQFREKPLLIDGGNGDGGVVDGDGGDAGTQPGENPATA